MKAIWNGKVIAESNETIMVENNYYFPESSVNKEYLEDSNLHTTCPWKGDASYFHIKIGENLNHDAAWYYPNPKYAAGKIKDYVAFWKDVQVVNS